MVDDLLDVSRISTGRLTLNQEDTELGELVKDILSRNEQSFRSAGIELASEIDTNVIACVDRLRFEQVISNLISNAIKYAPGKPLRVSLHIQDESALLVVEDRGPGIPKNYHVKIFQRYERAVRGPTAASGLGLGLYISKQIVEAHGGTISVQSEPGAGTRFKIQLPLRRKGVSACAS